MEEIIGKTPVSVSINNYEDVLEMRFSDGSIANWQCLYAARFQHLLLTKKHKKQ